MRLERVDGLIHRAGRHQQHDAARLLERGQKLGHRGEAGELAFAGVLFEGGALAGVQVIARHAEAV